jgi:hypothetical protein
VPKERAEIRKTLGDADLGYLDDVQEGDISRGYFAAAPEGNYEGSLDGDTYIEFDDDGKMTEHEAGTMHAGQLEADGYRGTHGNLGEYGFVRRPLHKTDVERN